LILKYIENQTDEICFIAVQNNGLALEFVKNKTPEICLAAITNNSAAYVYIKLYTNCCKPEDDCSICYDNNNEDWCKLHGCTHKFHKKCIDSWWKIKPNVCPYCNTLSVLL